MKIGIPIVAGLAAALAVQAAPRRSPPGKNVRVLTSLKTWEELYGSMLFVSAALGVRCDHCHAGSDFDRDEKPTKETARKMMKMVFELRRWAPPSSEITCYTCHRGQPKPQSIPPLATDAGEKRDAPGGALPSLEDVLARHRRATGEEARLARLGTMVMRGRATAERVGQPAQQKPVEIVKKAPDKVVLVEGSGDDAMTIGANGAVGWRYIRGKVMPLGDIDLARARGEAMFAAAVDARAPYERMTVVATATFDGAPAVIVDAVPKERTLGPLAIDREELTFDARSGLLLRRRLVARSALGAVPSAVEYGDFRTVDGVTLPFRVKRVFPGFVETVQLDDVKLDAPVPDERFDPPRQ
ncbi:MAG TPA: photosynthetic reaction center cytochrome c subunit family protein [Haliangiales bacterium]|nr:photosynthetic reaction center cytochrome c subunit family protein [Haliangiales bacterium]